MHDTRLEDQLRSALRTEGHALPFTVTPEELERRLALRRRERVGRRMTLMAAGVATVAIGTVLALSSGLIPPSGVAGDSSPSPAIASPRPATPIPTFPSGMIPIEGHPDGTLVEAVRPTDSGPGRSHRFTVPGSTTAGGWVWIECRGAGAARISVVDETFEPVCDGATDPNAFNVPLSDTDQQVVITLPAGVWYALLVEMVPLPSELPPLDALTEPAQVEGASGNAMPDWAAPDVLITTVVGTIQAAPFSEVKFACLGPGTIQVGLHVPGAPLSDPPITATTNQCHGQPDGLTSSVGDQGPLDVVVTATKAVAWRLSAAGLAALP
jgi:hypothetical protein